MDASVKTRARAAANDGPSARHQLLAAASTLMIERDTVDIPLAEIARRARLNVALVSYYFGGKDGLLIALAKRDAERSVSDLATLLGRDMTPAAKLRRHLVAIVHTYFKYPYLNRLLHALMRDSTSKSARKIAECFAAPIAKAQTQLLREAAEAGELRPVDPMMFNLIVFGACESLFAARSALKFVHGIDAIDDALHQRFADTVADLLMKGCLAPQSGISRTRAKPETGNWRKP